MSGPTASGEKGAKGYFSHFLQPFPFLLPLNIIEEITKPISLALRLFGNIFAGGILLALIGSLTAWTIGVIPVGGVLSVFFASCGSSSTWRSA